jgi:hypothetical protein
VKALIGLLLLVGGLVVVLPALGVVAVVGYSTWPVAGR